MQASVIVYIGLGSNQGDRRMALCRAVSALSRHGVEPRRVSRLYDTDYVGPAGPQAAYLNGVLEARTGLTPLELLDVTQAIELAAGRRPGTHQLPRPLDLDILLYGDCTITHPRLTVPHRQLAARRFVLQPLDDLGVLAARPELVRCLRALESHQALHPAGDLTPEEWRAEPVA